MWGRRNVPSAEGLHHFLEYLHAGAGEDGEQEDVGDLAEVFLLEEGEDHEGQEAGPGDGAGDGDQVAGGDGLQSGFEAGEGEDFPGRRERSRSWL